MKESEKIEMKVKILTKQIEYYFSDNNLKRDKYFNELIRKCGHLPIESVLKCNKVKAITQDSKVVMNAVMASEILELNADGTGIVRKGQPIPELERTGKRKEILKEEAEEGYLNEADLSDPVVISITGPVKPKSSWREIEIRYKEKYPDRKVLYTRYNNGGGQLLVSSNKQNVDKLEGEELEKFWVEHGNHYNLCINKKLAISKLKKKKIEKKKKNIRVSVELGGFVYDDIKKIKSKARIILNYKENDSILNESEKKFMIDLLKYHHKAEEKLRDLKDICVSVHPIFTDTRCFMIIRNDGTREDFSVFKCIENIKNKINTEKDKTN